MTPPAAKPASPLLPIGAQLAAMISIQFGATLAKALYPVVGAEGASALRLVMAALILSAVMRPWRGAFARRDTDALSGRDKPALSWGATPALLAYGATVALMNLLFFEAIATIPLGIAVAVEFLGPLCVATLSSRRGQDFGWIGLAVLGLAALLVPSGVQHALDPMGVLFALGAAAAWALYMFTGRRAGQAAGPYAASLGMIIAAVLVLPIGILHAGALLLRPSILLTAVGVGLFSSALPFSLEMVALTRLPARVYGTLTSLEPALGALMGLLLLQQALSLRQWAGIAAVVVAASCAALSLKPGET